MHRSEKEILRFLREGYADQKERVKTKFSPVPPPPPPPPPPKKKNLPRWPNETQGSASRKIRPKDPSIETRFMDNQPDELATPGLSIYLGCWRLGAPFRSSSSNGFLMIGLNFGTRIDQHECFRDF